MTQTGESKQSRKNESPSCTAATSGPNGIALAPPDYGIDFVDRAAGADRLIQRQAAPFGEMPVANAATCANHTGLPHNLKAGIEQLSGFDMSDVRVHYNSSRPAAMQAAAYAQGTQIHLAPQQDRHLPHEAWHVVQQKQRRVRPTMQLNAGLPVNHDARLEHEADVMGTKSTQLGRSGAQPKRSDMMKGNALVQDLSIEANDDRMQRGERSAPYPNNAKPVVIAPVEPTSVIQLKKFTWDGEDWIEKTTGRKKNNKGKLGKREGEFIGQEYDGRQKTLTTRDQYLLNAFRPKVLDSPDIAKQKQIHKALLDLDENVKDKDGAFLVVHVGGIKLPTGIRKLSDDALRKDPTLVCDLPLAAQGMGDIRRNIIAGHPTLKTDIASLVIQTMINQGQIMYFRGWDPEEYDKWEIVAEVHYYPDRDKKMTGFHKDTTGDTLFANLNYFTDQEIEGPQFVANPAKIVKHEEKMKTAVPEIHMKDLELARAEAGEASTVESAGKIAKFGGVSFSDLFVHHATPELSYRTITAKELQNYFLSAEKSPFSVHTTKFLFELAKLPLKNENEIIDRKRVVLAEIPEKLIDKIYFGSITAGELKDYFLSGASPIPAQTTEFLYRLAKLPPTKEIGRPMMVDGGLTDELIDKILWYSNSLSAAKYRNVGISGLALGHQKGANVPQEDAMGRKALVRQASRSAMATTNREFPAQVTIRRSFLRTWVRAIKK